MRRDTANNALVFLSNADFLYTGLEELSIFYTNSESITIKPKYRDKPLIKRRNIVIIYLIINFISTTTG